MALGLDSPSTCITSIHACPWEAVIKSPPASNLTPNPSSRIGWGKISSLSFPWFLPLTLGDKIISHCAIVKFQ